MSEEGSQKGLRDLGFRGNRGDLSFLFFILPTELLQGQDPTLRRTTPVPEGSQKGGHTKRKSH